MRPSAQPLSPLLVEHQRELDAWSRQQRQRRRTVRVRIGITCLTAFAFLLLTRWCHTAVRPLFCNQSRITCEEFTNSHSTWHWSYWGAAAMLALTIMGVAAITIMTAIWFSSLGRRLHIRGPEIKTENRLAFISWFSLTTAVTLGYGLFWYTIVHLGR